MKIAILGAGNVGSALGHHLLRREHEVRFGVRDPESDRHASLAKAGASTSDIRSAAAFGELGILATPWAAVEAVLNEAGDWQNKPLIDATNPLGPGFRLTHGHTDSGGEQVARWAENARVVKAFNTTGAENMADPDYGVTRPLMLLCGDDDAACAAVHGLVEDMGFQAVRLGGLDQARLLEPLALVWITMAIRLGMGRDFAFGMLTRPPGGGTEGAS